MFCSAKPKPTVHSGGIKAVAIATPKIAELIFSFFVFAIIRARPPKKAIKTSLISGLVLDNNSDISSPRGKIKKKKYEVTTLNTTITIKLIKEFLSVSISFVAIEKPSPRIGPKSGEINIAPITTGVEFAFKPTDAIKIEQINTQAVVPLMEISALIAFTVEFLSTSL